MTDLETILKLGTTPFPGASPAGASARYDPEFEKLQGEIEKMESASASPVRWEDVLSLSSGILGTKSKDLVVAAYLALALFQVQGTTGLAAGLTVFKDLMGTFWETLFPPVTKMRGREAAVRWLDERLARALAAAPAAAESDRVSLKSSETALDGIASILREKMAGGAPSLGDSIRAVREKMESIPPPPVAEAAAPEPPREAAPPPPAEIDSAERAHEAIRKAAAYLRRANPADPLPYRLVRALVRSGLSRPEADARGATKLTGGDSSFLERAASSLERGEHASVLSEAEERLAAEPLWLDLDFLSFRALEGLGSAFEEARRSVLLDVKQLIERMPDLTRLRFENGTPLAGDAARLWIDGEVASRPAGPGAPEGLEEALAGARGLASRGKLPGATALLQKAMQGLPPGRERFRWRLELARLCLDAGQPSLALPLFESLDEEASRYRLEEWEPAICVDIVKQLWQCYSALPKLEGAGEKAAQTHARLCRLDLTAAMALGESRR